jgi:hypothetical protein
MLYICLYYFSMQAHFQFNDFESALVFNGAFIAGTLAAMYLQFREGKRKAYPLATWVTVIAVFNGLLVAGSRLGGFSLADWATLFGKGIFPPHAEKTVMGGLLLALPVYFIVKRSWITSGGIFLPYRMLVFGMLFWRAYPWSLGALLRPGHIGICLATKPWAYPARRRYCLAGPSRSALFYPQQLSYILYTLRQQGSV